MAIVITQEINITIFPRVPLQIIGFSDRYAVSYQLQALGRLWVKLTGPASADDGFITNGYQPEFIATGLGQQTGSGFDYYQGPIHLFWDGAHEDGELLESANIRMIEIAGSRLVMLQEIVDSVQEFFTDVITGLDTINQTLIEFPGPPEEEPIV